ncbi:hypothetical protein GCM10008090_30670 [Arenicella chitinivorans]|uniref:Uncharacterized protein n=1 Tax=Arenicella chitinivorans TaxID=1329800 RepID=A0A918VRX4_9GAMM|nr:hypothetical protein [Arenicella chitinivorans]GHA18889.1 hypothetical protein GCM10008090_30670 [Arenicella chitinivorans]
MTKKKDKHTREEEPIDKGNNEPQDVERKTQRNDDLPQKTPIKASLIESAVTATTPDSIKASQLDPFNGIGESAADALKAMKPDHSDIMKSAMGLSTWEAMQNATKSIEQFSNTNPSAVNIGDSLERLTSLTNQMREVETKPIYQVGHVEIPTFMPNSHGDAEIPEEFQKATNQIVEKLEQQLVEKNSQHHQMTEVFGNFVTELSSMNTRLGQDAVNSETHAKQSRNLMWISLVVTAAIAMGALIQNHIINIDSTNVTLRLIELEENNAKGLIELTSAIEDLKPKINIETRSESTPAVDDETSMNKSSARESQEEISPVKAAPSQNKADKTNPTKIVINQ